jgi:FSR family fosmidomycin resistance protein-like MFS transporter
MRLELDRRGIAALSAGHGAVDFASGAVPALLPFLADRFDLSYTLTAVIMLCATVSSSVVQPLFGLLSDRRGAMWLLPGGVLLAGCGIAFAGVAPSYGVALVAVFLAGIGVAAYHPEGAKFASYASGRRRASGMSLFNVGGNTGYALGPIVITPIVVWLGLNGTLVAALPVLAVGVGVMVVLPYLRNLQPDRATRAAAADDRPAAMALLAAIILLRSTTWFGLITFVPLWVVSLGHSKADGNRLLSLMLLAGVAGALAFGPIADRVGLRKTLLGSTVALPPLVLTFVYAGGPVGAAALMLVGACVVGTFGVVMVLSQLYLPRHVALASGLNVGLAVGLGGVAAVALGAVADAVDLETALTICALTPVLAAILCLALPAPQARLAPAPAGA